MENVNQVVEESKIENSTEVEKDASEKVEEKLFTQSDIEAIISKRFAKEKLKQEAEKEKLRQEAEKEKLLAQMNAEEKLRYELEERDRLISEYESKAKRATLQTKAIDKAKELGIDTSLAKFIIGKDEDETAKNAEVLKDVWEAAIKTATDRALAGVTPVKPSIETKTEMTKEHFKKMSLVEQQDLYVNNRELYNKLSK